MGGVTWSSSLVLAAITIKSGKSQIVAKIVARIWEGILAKESVKNYQSAIEMLASSVCVGGSFVVQITNHDNCDLNRVWLNGWDFLPL